MKRQPIPEHRMRRRVPRLFGLILLMFYFAGIANAGDATEFELFKKELFDSHYFGGLLVGDFDKSKKRDVLEAKKMLISFFDAVAVSERDPLHFLGHDLRAKFKNGSDLWNKIFGPEMELYYISVIAVYLDQSDELTLDFYLVLFVEGALELVVEKAILKKEGADWKITRIGALE